MSKGIGTVTAWWHKHWPSLLSLALMGIVWSEVILPRAYG